jgi:GATA-binding protein, other eukaryote
VSELEVIQDLFRGRVDELEKSERAAKQAEEMQKEEVVRLKTELEKAEKRIKDLVREGEDLEGDVPPRKMAKRELGKDHGDETYLS